MLSAAAETDLERIWIFRFPNVVGPRTTHGALHDFAARLARRPANPAGARRRLAEKTYVHVSELIEAMRFITVHAQARRNLLNIGPDGEGTRVSFMAQAMIDQIAPGTAIAYAGGDRGWVGDVPRFRYSAERLARLGWKPKLSSGRRRAPTSTPRPPQRPPARLRPAGGRCGRPGDRDPALSAPAKRVFRQPGQRRALCVRAMTLAFAGRRARLHQGHSRRADPR